MVVFWILLVAELWGEHDAGAGRCDGPAASPSSADEGDIRVTSRVFRASLPAALSQVSVETHNL
jgi:hypothetical protein